MRCLNEQRTDYIHALFARFTVKQCLVLLNLRGPKVKAKYLYSYDDVKVQDAGGTNGYDYLGSLTLVKTSGTQTPETHFGEGIIRGTQVMYFENDHLGSIRTVLNTAGTVIERNDYYPFGMRHANASHVVTANNRYKFNGKEDQTVGALGLLDYGARMYDAQIGRWLGVDPPGSTHKKNLKKSSFQQFNHFAVNNLCSVFIKKYPIFTSKKIWYNKKPPCTSILKIFRITVLTDRRNI